MKPHDYAGPGVVSPSLVGPSYQSWAILVTIATNVPRHPSCTGAIGSMPTFAVRILHHVHPFHPLLVSLHVDDVLTWPNTFHVVLENEQS